MFFPRVPLPALIDLCRRLRIGLDAGIFLPKIFGQNLRRMPGPLRGVCQRVADRLRRGDSLHAALAAEPAFPELLLAVTAAGEESGRLVKTFAALEDYYTGQLRLRRQFRTDIIAPVVQFVLATLIVATVIFVLGAFGNTGGLFGLSGAGGAVLFLVVVFGGVGLAVLGFRLLLKQSRGAEVTEQLLLRVPAVGGCLQALALGRFALTLQLTMDAGMPITRAVRLSLTATGNAAFRARADAAEAALRKGDDLSVALARTGVFPGTFLDLLAVAEAGGSVPEAMEKEYRNYQEEAERRMKALTQTAAWAVWAAYAAFMVILISQIAGVYFRSLGL